MEDQTLTAALAILFGAAHAIEPGHGKTALFTYLASGNCSWKDGMVIALSSAITHSAVVLILALISHHFLGHKESLDNNLLEGLRYLGGGIICLFGVFFFFKKNQSNCSHCDDHHHHHHHHHDKKNSQADVKKSLFASGLIGFATGLMPCPTIVVAYLAGVSRGSSFSGLWSVLLFALGMAISLILLVLIFSFGNRKLSGIITNRIPRLNWNRVQGVTFFVIGCFTLFFH